MFSCTFCLRCLFCFPFFALPRKPGSVYKAGGGETKQQLLGSFLPQCWVLLKHFLKYFILCEYVHVMPLHHVCAWYLKGPEEGIGFSETGVVGGCEMPCRCWKQNLDPLKQQSLTLSAEPFSSPVNGLFNNHIILCDGQLRVHIL